MDDGTGTGPFTPGTEAADNDKTSFSVGDVSISEGGLMTFTVTRTGDAEANQTVDFATSIGGSDTSEAGDFTSNTGTLTFAKGETSKTFTVQTTVDAVYEGSENFTVTLSNNSTGSTIADGTGVGTILDDGTGTGPFTPGTSSADDDRPTLTLSSSITVDETVGDQSGTNEITAASGAISTASISGAASLSGSLELSENSVTTYSLINSLGNSFNGLDSGLRVTGGNAIYLYGSGSTIYGKEGTPSAASSTGAVAFTLVIDQTTGDVTLNQIKPIDHLVDTPISLPNEVASVSGLFYVSASVTNINGASLTVKSTSAIDLKFYDDGPILTGVNTTNVDKTLNASVTDTFDTIYGADGKASVDPLTLTFRGTAPANFTLVQDAVDDYIYYGKTGSQNVFKVVLNDSVSGPENSSYTFTLLNPTPQLMLQNSNLLQGISGGSNLASYTFAATSFDNLFALTLTGWNIDRAGNKVANDITISSTALGVGGNTINQSAAEILRIDLGQIDPTATAISLKIGVDTTAGIKNGDQIKVNYFYVGSSSPVTDLVTYDNSGFITINEFDVNKVVDYFEISPATTNTNMKIVGLSFDYGKTIPLPNQFDFALVAKDGDADASTAANFSVTLNNVVSGAPTIDAVDIVIADTTANDSFANNSGTLSATDAQIDAITYGISTGVAGSWSIGGVSYDVSKTSVYGTLYVKSTTGQYIFEPNSSAINALTSFDSLTFTVTASDGTNVGNGYFTVNLFGVNDAPTNITLTDIAPAGVAENTASATVIATLATTDADAGDTFTYSLVAGTGGNDADNSLVEIVGNEVRVKSGAMIDYETNPVLNLNIRVADAGGLTYDKAFTLNVTNVNEAPVNTLPASFSTNEDTTVKLSGLSVSDADSTSGTLVLSVASGTLAASNAGSVTVSGSGTGSITLTGTFANINTYLGNTNNQPVYTPVANANGAVVLTMTSSDGSLTDTDTININIAAIADAPINTLPASFSTNEDTTVKLSGLSVSDADSTSGTLVLSVASGTLAASNAGSVTVSGSGTGSITLTGTFANINTYLGNTNNQPVYTPVANANGAVVLTMTSSDGSLTDTDTININIAAIADAPIANADRVITDNATLTSFNINLLLANDTDIDLNSLTATYASASSSGLTVTGTNPLNISSIASNDVLGYQVSDGTGTANGTATFTLDQDGTMTGTSADEIFAPTGLVSTTLSGGGKNAISVKDVIENFATGQNDILDIFSSGSATVMGAISNSDGTNNSTGQTSKVSGTSFFIDKHSVNSNGMVTFTDTNEDIVTMDNADKVAAAVNYLSNNDIGNAGTTVAFTASISAVNHTYVYSQATASAGGSLVDLSGVAATGITTNLDNTTANYIHIA